MKPPPEPRPVRNRHSGEDRRRETVAAVLELAAEGLPERITTAKIAERIGLSAGALFRHFPDKESVWEAVMEWVGECLEKRFARVEQEAASTLEALDGMFMEHIRFVSRHPGVPRLVFAELQRPGDTPAKRIVRRVLASHAGRLESWLEKGRADGELRPDLEVREAAGLLIGTVQGLVMQSLLAGDSAHLERTAPGMFRIFRRGIEAKS